VKKIICLLASLLLSDQLLAQTMYITDNFAAPMRTGPTDAYRVRLNLNSGLPLEIIEVNDETGYSKVVTKAGTEGWVLNEHLMGSPAAKTRLVAAQQQLIKLKESNKKLSREQSDATQKAAQLSNQNTLLEAANSALKKELDDIKIISANAITLNQRNQQLIQENQQFKNAIDLLGSDNERLKNNANSEYFMMGAGAILLGLIMGLILPSIKRRRKDTGWI
jgi:SH3 domain protein